eukprot:COSAG05_NODE_840_length_7027_cov_416.630052_1_plen_468_part_10
MQAPAARRRRQPVACLAVDWSTAGCFYRSRQPAGATMPVEGCMPGPPASACPCGFYGWVILVICISTKIVATAGTLRMITFLVPSMVEDPLLGMQPEILSTLFSAGTLLGALGAPLLGSAIDRFGARVCIPAGCIAAGSALLLLSVAVHPVLLVLSFFCVRLMCLGGLMMWSTVPISQWFNRKRGRAQSYLIVISTLCTSVLVFPAWQQLIDDIGWRSATQIAGFVALAMAVPTSIFIYSTPEIVGCRPDGEQDTANAGYEKISRTEEESDAVGTEASASDGGERSRLIDDAKQPSESSSSCCSSSGSRRDGGAVGSDGPPPTNASPTKLVQQVGGRTVVLPNSGSGTKSETSDETRSGERRSFSLRQALRTRAFYLICFDSMSGCILGAGTFFHLIPIIRENGGTHHRLLATSEPYPSPLAVPRPPPACLPIVSLLVLSICLSVSVFCVDALVCAQQSPLCVPPLNP